MHRSTLAAAGAAACLTLTLAPAPAAGTAVHDGPRHPVAHQAVAHGHPGRHRAPKRHPRTVRHKAVLRIRSAAARSAVAVTAPITYHRGPIMTGTTHLYYLWYGAWRSATAKPILTDFGTSVGGSAYYAINTTYTDAKRNTVSNAVSLAGSTSDPGSLGTTLSDSDVLTLVRKAITAGSLPVDAHGLFVVLTSREVKESSGFVTSYCGWHDHATVGGTDIAYAFVGDPTTQGLSHCAAQTTSSPNGNPGVDAMVSVVAHELVEAVTDPDLNAWYDRGRNENADKCAWTFGRTYRADNGSTANLQLGDRDFLVQRNWKAGRSQGCAMSL